MARRNNGGVRRARRMEDHEVPQTRPLKDHQRPKTRADCKDGPRPCPFVRCRFHLYLSVTKRGTIILRHPGKELWELPETCALDVAERGAPSLEEPGDRIEEDHNVSLDVIGELMGMSHERVRQVEEEAMAKLRKKLAHLRADITGEDEAPPTVEVRIPPPVVAAGLVHAIGDTPSLPLDDLPIPDTFDPPGQGDQPKEIA